MPPPPAPPFLSVLRPYLTPRRLLLFLLWLVLLFLTTRVFPEPAAVQLFLTLSAALLVATNFSPRARRADELSAYSVFNPGGMPLLGALRAEQFDAEVRHRPTEWGLDDGQAARAEGPGDEGRRRGFQGVGHVLGKEDGGEDGEMQAALEATRREVFLEARRSRFAAAASRRRG